MNRARLHIDFAPGAGRVPGVGRWLLLLSAIVLGAVAYQVGGIWAQRVRAETSLAEMETRRSGDGAVKPVALKGDPKQVATTRAARQVAGSLMTPWAALFTSLGSAPTASVALLSVEPSVTKRSVRLTAEARDAHEMLAYLEVLQRDARLSSVVLVSHQLQVQAPGSPLRFQIQAEWGNPR